MSSLPLILLTFANDKADYLPGIGKEMAQLETLLTPIAQRLDFELKLFPYTDSHALLDYLNANRERLVLLHFAGHSNSDVLQLDDGEWHIKGFAAKLGNCPHLRLVVLNGCQNAAQVHALRAANVAAVIGTHAPIGDQTATEFTRAFYQAFAKRGLPLVEAFRQAHLDMEIQYQSSFRTLDIDTQHTETVWSWFLEPPQATWKLLEAAEPCNRLPVIPHSKLPSGSPFKNLEYYTPADANVFFGRCEELLEVIDRLNSMSADVLLIHSAAGIGKTSFLLAGLYPRLQANGQHVRYFRYNGLDPSRHLLEQIFGSTAPDAIRTLIDQPAPNGLPAVWIIDQMEEAFVETIRPEDTNATEPPKLTELLQTLHQVFTPPPPLYKPRAKLVVTLRKEWFPDLLTACRTHDISLIDYPLKPLNKAAIISIICSPVDIPLLQQAYRLRIDPPGTELAVEIADDLLLDPQSNIAPALQIILSRLWEQVQAADDRVWNLNLYASSARHGLLLKEYLEQQLKKITATRHGGLEAAAKNGLLLDILHLHISEYGTSRNINVTEYSTLYPHVPYLADLIKTLKDNNLLIEPYTHGTEPFATQTRLAHDSLAPVVARKFAASTLSGNRARRILDNRKQDWCKTADGQWRGPLLDEHDLQAILRGQNGTTDWHHDECENSMVTSSLKRQKSRQRTQMLLASIGTLVFALFFVFLYYHYQQTSQVIYTLLTRSYYLSQQREDTTNRDKALLLTLQAASLNTDKKISHDIYRAMSYVLHDIARKTYPEKPALTVKVSNNQTIAIWDQAKKQLAFFKDKQKLPPRPITLDWFDPKEDYMRFSEQGILAMISTSQRKLALWRENGEQIAELSFPENFQTWKNHIDLSPQNTLLLMDAANSTFILQDLDTLGSSTQLMPQRTADTIPPGSLARFTMQGNIMLLDTQNNRIQLYKPNGNKDRSIPIDTDYGTDYIRQISNERVLTWQRANSTFFIHDIRDNKTRKEERYDGHYLMLVNPGSSKNRILSYNLGGDATLWDADSLTPVIDRFFLPGMLLAHSPDGNFLVFHDPDAARQHPEYPLQLRALDSFMPEQLQADACQHCRMCRDPEKKQALAKEQQLDLSQPVCTTGSN